MMLARTVFLIAFLLAGCKQMPTLPMLPSLTPYTMDVQQGNVVTQEMMSKLKPGMTPSQVRFILGTPLVVDAFHKDRWDYVYRYTKGGTVQEQRRIVIVFQDDKLARIEGDVVPGRPGGTTDEGVKIDKPVADPARPAAAKPAPSTTKPQIAAPAQPEASKLVTTTGEASTGSTSLDAAGAAATAAEEKPKEEKTQDEKPQEERGFFGRMLEKLGF